MALEQGPYVAIACLCEMVIEDKTGVLSLIRIIDRLTHTEAGPNPPKEMPPFTHSWFLVLTLKSGMAQGRYDIRIQLQRPDGSVEDVNTTTVHFEGEEKGHNLIGQIITQFHIEGLHWYKIYLEDGDRQDLLTAVPFRVMYNRVTHASIPSA